MDNQQKMEESQETQREQAMNHFPLKTKIWLRDKRIGLFS